MPVENMADDLEQFKKDFSEDYSATEEQRDKSNEEFRFFTVPGGQWEGFLEDHYQNRSKLELDQTSDYVYRTYGQWTQNRIGITYSPDDDKTTDSDADILNGLYRKDFRRNNGVVAIDNAVLEVMGAGTGAFHIATEYVDKESVDDDRMRVVFRPIHNAYSMVAWDSTAKRIDKADAKRCTVVHEYSKDAFMREYPDLPLSSAVRPNDRRLFNWTTKTGVYVAERYEIKKEKAIAYIFQNPLTGKTENLTSKRNEERETIAEAKRQGMELSRKKEIERQYVVKSIFYGDGFIKKNVRIQGKYIPIIPLYGYRAYIDGAEFFHGLVRKRMDAQRLFNMEVSLVAENAATANKRIPLFTEEQMERVKNLWATDISKKNYLLADPVYDKQGNIQHLGPTGYLEPPVMDENTRSLIELTSNFIGTGTGGSPQDTIDPDASGKAINAILKRVDLNVQPIIENIATGLKWAGEVYRAIAADIHTQHGKARVLAEDGTESMVTLMELSMDTETGEPTTINDLSKGRFEVVIDTGPAYETKREETVETLKDILSSLDPNHPYYSAVLGLLIENLDGPGIDDLRDYVKRDLLIKGVKQPETDEDQAVLDSLNQEDPQDELIEAATQQQLAEAESLRAKSEKDYADAELKRAEAVDTVEDIDRKKIETLSNVLAR